MLNYSYGELLILAGVRPKQLPHKLEIHLMLADHDCSSYVFSFSLLSHLAAASPGRNLTTVMNIRVP
jgi:hypothetical protein